MAKILPLDSKYYGTRIAYGKDQELIVWNTAWYDFAPSERELANGWTEDYGQDHVESQADYEIANLLCETLTKAGY